MYQWWVFVHILGLAGFLAAHGISMAVTFRLRRERDPQRVNDLLALSGSSAKAMYLALVVLLAGGIGAATVGRLWSKPWIWISIGVLVVATALMYAVAKPFYDRVRLVARARAAGSQAVTDEQWESVLRSGRADAISAVGIVALVIILYMMVFKPTFGVGDLAATPVPAATSSGAPAPGVSVAVSAQNSAFATSSLTAPAGTPFTIVFDNQDAGVQHNVAIYKDSALSQGLFRGALVSGPATVRYSVQALPAGNYVFHCDVHPPMTGTLVVK